jgi:hypothetical protein
VPAHLPRTTACVVALACCRAGAARYSAEYPGRTAEYPGRTADAPLTSVEVRGDRQPLPKLDLTSLSPSHTCCAICTVTVTCPQRHHACTVIKCRLTCSAVQRSAARRQAKRLGMLISTSHQTSPNHAMSQCATEFNI